MVRLSHVTFKRGSATMRSMNSSTMASAARMWVGVPEVCNVCHVLSAGTSDFLTSPTDQGVAAVLMSCRHKELGRHTIVC